MKLKLLCLLIFIVAALSAQVSLDPRYHTYDEILQELFAYQDSFPDIVHLQQIGTTLGAVPYQDPIPIWAIKLSQNASVDEDEPAVMYAGQCHAEEVLGVEITMYMIQEIITKRNLQPFSIWLQNLEMWFVPTYNPEGLQVVMDDWDVTFRKNKRDNNLNGFFDFVPGPGGDIDGVDPNRNYSFNWIHGEELYEGTGDEWNDYYRGPGPFSEGGTQAIRDLAAQQHFLYSINWHSSRSGNFSEKVYYSFKWEDEKPAPDLDLHSVIGQNVADLIENESGIGNYLNFASSGRKGNAHDWFYKAHGTCQLLIECGTENLQPTNDPPLYLVDDTCERCRIGAYWLLNRCLGYNADVAMLTGHVTDANSGNPLVARYFVEEKFAGFFDAHYTDALYGRYWRPIMPGTYNLHIVKKGYEESITTITVNNSQWTTVDVQLNPLDLVIVNGNVNCNGTPVDGKIIVDNGEYIEPDIIEFTNGNFSFENYVGEHEITIIADGCVPQVTTIDFPAGTYDFICTLNEAEVIFNENFETSLSNWTIDGDWALVENSTTGTYSVTDSPDEFYQNGSTAVLTLQSPINLSQATNDVVIELWHKYHTEHDCDYCFLEYSTNGTDWTTQAAFDGYPGEWNQEIIPIPQLVNTNVYLRFVLATDDSVNDPGWWIDQIRILATDGAGTAPEIPPVRSSLYQNYPNPFNPSTRIKYDLSGAGKVNLSIFNLKGQKVKTLVNEVQSAGNKEYNWNGTDDDANPVASGVYFYKLSAPDFDQTHKMILLK